MINKEVQYYNSKIMGFDTHPELEKKKHNHKKNTSEESIAGCFEFFRKASKLDKDNSWYCNVCKDHVEAFKQIELYTAPPVLILCLQRFKSHGNYFKEKLEDKIVFPLENFDISPYIVSAEQKQSTSMLYDLVAVSNHFGSLGFGHYTAYCLDPNTNEWYDFNDSSVYPLQSKDNVVSSAAYVLYYKRKDFYPDGNVNFDLIKKQPDD